MSEWKKGLPSLHLSRYCSDKYFADYASNKKMQSLSTTLVLTIQYACKKMKMDYSEYERLIELGADYLELVNSLNSCDSKRN